MSKAMTLRKGLYLLGGLALLLGLWGFFLRFTVG